jgi:hypothetical protein
LSFELINCRDDLSHVVVMKLRVAGKGKTLFRMGLGAWQTARVAAHVLTARLTVCRNWIMNQGFDPVLAQEVRQAIPFSTADDEQMVDMTLFRIRRR